MSTEHNDWQLFADGCMHGLRKGARPTHPVPGGWASIVRGDGAEHIQCGHEEVLTPDRMELMGVVQGLHVATLSNAQQPIGIDVFSDSMYVLRATFAKLDEKRRKRTFDSSTIRKKHKKIDLLRNPHPGHKEDADLTQQLGELLRHFDVRFVQVLKTSAPEEHARCHAIASEMRWKLAIALGYATSRHRDPR